MAAGGGDFERALGDVLAADVFEVEWEVLEFVEQTGGLDTQRFGGNGAERGGVEQFANLQ